RFSGKTNADGVVLAPGAARLLGLKPRGSEGDENDWAEWDDVRARRMIVTAQAGDDLAVLDTNWNNGIQIWNFGLNQDGGGGEARRFQLAGNYLYGSPLHGAKASWSVRRRARLPEFPGFEGYAFQDMAALWDQGRWWARSEERSFSDAVADGEVELDGAGRATV